MEIKVISTPGDDHQTEAEAETKSTSEEVELCLKQASGFLHRSISGHLYAA